ncbi:MAG: TIGR02281 family clan AA aspartic protease [Xanthobacteraceae bacterium]
MLKAVLFLAGLAIAIALFAPDYLARVVGRRDIVAVALPTESERPQANADQGGTVRLSADRNGHYFTEAEINNRPLGVLVDTGATLVALRYEDARSLGLVFPGDKFDIGVRTANGNGRARRVQLRSVSVGPITVRDVEALVLEQGALSANLLGMSFLKRLARFEVQRGKLELER